MAIVDFKYDFKKDAWSWVYIAKRKDDMWGMDKKKQIDFIPLPLLKQIIKKDKKEAEILIFNYLINHPKKKVRKVVIDNQIQVLEKSWEKIENVYFKTLEKVTQKPIYTKNFTCYITSGFMCPYNPEEDWFMASMWHGQPFSLTTIAHELMHLQFIHYYWDYLENEGLSREKIEDLKEALTFLLNEPEFNNFLLVNDKGYPNHQKLRGKLQKEWEKEKDFKKFLDKAIKIMKK